LEQAQESGFLRIEATVRASKADVHRDQGDYEQALEEYRRSLEIAERAHHPFIITYVLNGMANVWRLIGNHQKATAAARQALENARIHSSDYELGLSELTLGIICYERGDLEAGRRYVRRAAERFRRGNATKELARAHFHLAQIHYRARSSKRALEDLKRCADLVSELGYSQFLLMDSWRSPQLVAYAENRVPWAGRLAALLRQIRKPADRVEVHVPQPAPEAALQPHLEIFAFGRAEVFRDNQLVPHAEWVTSTAKEMLFYFLAFPEGLRKEQVTTAFWPDTSPAKSHSRFHVALYHIRRVLGGPHTLLYESGGRYCLAPALAYWFDVTEFERCLANASGKDMADSDAARNLRRAIELYRGDYLDEFYSDWCIPIREKLRQQYLAALADLAQYHARRSEYHESIHLCQLILTRDEYCEQAHQDLIRYYALVGDRAAAIRQYDLCVQLFREELGVEPLPETRQVYERIVRQPSGGDVSTSLLS
jgi:DNA-binding SARP family transcriptional activator